MNNFTSEFFARNRERLAEALPGHFLVLTAHSMLQSAADMAFPFRQDSSFWYLTGLNESDLLISIDCDSGKVKLYLPEQNDYQKEWDGALNKKELKDASGISQFAKNSQIEQDVKAALKDGKKIGCLPPLPKRVEPYGFYANPARQILEDRLAKIASKDSLVDVREQIARLRQIKQPIEVEAIQKAIDITAETMSSAKAKLPKYESEKDIERELSAGFIVKGADGHAFSPIIANGKNAATIHYEKNDAKLETGLVLLDVGASFNGYSADISRTWSVGKPSERQKQVWQACLDIQQKGFEMIKPGVTIRELQQQLEEIAQQKFEELDCSMSGERFPHGFSHHLGLDPHDAGLYDEPLQEGMVITLEPGIYLVDEAIGVRVEDDILITKNGYKNLSENIPKTL